MTDRIDGARTKTIGERQFNAEKKARGVFIERIPNPSVIPLIEVWAPSQKIRGQVRADFSRRLASGDGITLSSDTGARALEKRDKHVHVNLYSEKVTRSSLPDKLSDKSIKDIYWSGAIDYQGMSTMIAGLLRQRDPRDISDYSDWQKSLLRGFHKETLLTQLSEAFDLHADQRDVRLYNFSNTRMSDSQLATIASTIGALSEQSRGALLDNLSQVVILPTYHPVFHKRDGEKRKHFSGWAGDGVILLREDLLFNESNFRQFIPQERPILQRQEVQYTNSEQWWINFAYRHWHRSFRWQDRRHKRRLIELEKQEYQRQVGKLPYSFGALLGDVLNHEGHHILAQTYWREHEQFIKNVNQATMQYGELPPSQYAAGTNNEVDESGDRNHEILSEVGVALMDEQLSHLVGARTKAAYEHFIRSITYGRDAGTTSLIAQQVDANTLQQLHMEAPVRITIDNPERYFPQKLNQKDGSQLSLSAVNLEKVVRSATNGPYPKQYRLPDGRYLRISLNDRREQYYTDPYESITTVEWLSPEASRDGYHHSKGFRVVINKQSGEILLQRITRPYQGKNSYNPSRFGQYPYFVPYEYVDSYRDDFHTYDSFQTTDPIRRAEIQDVLTSVTNQARR